MSDFIESKSPRFWILCAILGFLLLSIVTWMFTPLGDRVSQKVSETFTEDYVFEKSIDFLVSTEGLEKTLKDAYSDFEVPEEIYDPLWLIAVETSGVEVRFTYQYRAEFDTSAEIYTIQEDQEEICAYQSNRYLLAYGTRFVNAYVDKNDAAIGTSETTAADCGVELF